MKKKDCVKAIQSTMTDLIGLVLYELGDAEADGLSFREGIDKVETALKERFHLDQAAIVGCTAKEALVRIEQNEPKKPVLANAPKAL